MYSGDSPVKSPVCLTSLLLLLFFLVAPCSMTTLVASLFCGCCQPFLSSHAGQEPAPAQENCGRPKSRTITHDCAERRERSNWLVAAAERYAKSVFYFSADINWVKYVLLVLKTLPRVMREWSCTFTFFSRQSTPQHCHLLGCWVCVLSVVDIHWAGLYLVYCYTAGGLKCAFWVCVTFDWLTLTMLPYLSQVRKGAHLKVG